MRLILVYRNLYEDTPQETNKITDTKINKTRHRKHTLTDTRTNKIRHKKNPLTDTRANKNYCLFVISRHLWLRITYY